MMKNQKEEPDKTRSYPSE